MLSDPVTENSARCLHGVSAQMNWVQRFCWRPYWLECEYQYKAAGFRTITLLMFGSTLYTLFSISIAETIGSTTRIASNIVTGIGFQRAHFLYFLNIIGGKIRIGL